MVAALAESWHQTLYKILCTIWREGSVPPEWKNRLIRLIPKIPTPTIDDLWPISLLEITRKLWFSLVLAVIKEGLSREGILSNAQHGISGGKGTHTASVQFINLLEEANLNADTLFYSTWDITRAFDSPAKNLMVQAWIRVGVPTRVAHLLVDLDTGGKSIVATPLSQRIIHRRGINGQQAQQYFVADRGSMGSYAKRCYSLH